MGESERANLIRKVVTVQDSLDTHAKVLDGHGKQLSEHQRTLTAQATAISEQHSATGRAIMAHTDLRSNLDLFMVIVMDYLSLPWYKRIFAKVPKAPASNA